MRWLLLLVIGLLGSTSRVEAREAAGSSPKNIPQEEYFRKRPVNGRDPAKELRRILQQEEFRETKDSPHARSLATRIATFIRGVLQQVQKWLKTLLDISPQQAPSCQWDENTNPGFLAKMFSQMGKAIQSIAQWIHRIMAYPATAYVFWGLLGLLVAYGVYRMLRALAPYWQRKPEEATDATETTELAETETPLLERTPEEIWQRAHEFAAQGQFRLAIREVYLILLLQMHRANLLQYDPTRTNWEYLHSLNAQLPLYNPFQQFTARFDRIWYGERACQQADFEECKQIAQTILTE